MTAAKSPAANAAGWNKDNLTVAWSATDAGSGSASTNPFASQTYTANFTKETVSQQASDRLGTPNVGQGTVNVWLDKADPGITATQTSATWAPHRDVHL